MFDSTIKKSSTFAAGEMAEWSIAAVLKTVEGQTSGGSNPSFSAKSPLKKGFFFFSLFVVNLISKPKLKRV